MLGPIFDLLSDIVYVVGLFLKVPQIIHIWREKKAVGLSVNALVLELASYTITMMYSFVNDHAYLSYLEYPIVVIQEYILLGLVMHYQCYKPKTYMSTLAIFFLISFAFAINLLNKAALSFLLPLAVPINAISKIIQLMEIMFKKNTDPVHVLIWFLLLFININRMYTALVETTESNLAMKFLLSSLLNGVIVASAIYYEKLSAERKFNI